MRKGTIVFALWSAVVATAIFRINDRLFSADPLDDPAKIVRWPAYVPESAGPASDGTGLEFRDLGGGVLEAKNEKGEIPWRLHLAGAPAGTRLQTRRLPGLLLVVDGDRWAVGVDPGRGEIRWARPIMKTSLPVEATEDGIYLVSSLEKRTWVSKLDPRDGGERWRAVLEEERAPGGIVVRNGVVKIAFAERGADLDAETGRTVQAQ